MTTTMWEARAAAGQVDALVAWVLWRVDADTAVYRSADGEDRVVVIDQSGRAAQTLARTPAHLVARPAHVWDFESVRDEPAARDD